MELDHEDKNQCRMNELDSLKYQYETVAKSKEIE